MYFAHCVVNIIENPSVTIKLPNNDKLYATFKIYLTDIVDLQCKRSIIWTSWNTKTQSFKALQNSSQSIV